MESDHPESDDSRVCDGRELTLLRAIIGAVLWIERCCRPELMNGRAMISGFQVLGRARIGHLERAFRMLGYLKKTKTRGLLIDGNADVVTGPQLPTELDDLGIYDQLHEYCKDRHVVKHTRHRR